MHKKAFTLIELLVVVAIVGLLSSIVLVNIKGTRDKANDANIQSFMHQLRNAAEVSYASNNESYTEVCDETDDTLSNAGEIGILEDMIENENSNQSVKCFESADKMSFAASFPMKAKVGKYWCVESAGLSRKIDLEITSALCE